MSEPIEIRVPDIGDFDGVPVIEIHVAPGDTVAPEDPLVTLESDKATMDVPSPVAGKVTDVSVQIGDTVAQGAVIVSVEVDAAATAGAARSGSAPTPSEPQHSPPAPQPSAPVGSTSPPATTGGGPLPGAAAPSNGARADHDAQVVVIGSGPGGYTAAFRAADLGLKTVLIEKYDTLGGVCLNVGCIPSKALLHAAKVIAEADEMAEHGISFGEPQVDLESLISWKQSVVGKLTGGLTTLARQRKVEVVQGAARFTGPDTVQVGERTISFDNCIIAAGSQSATLPFLPDDPRIIDSTGALSPTEIPDRMLVIGGGIIGLEMATVYDALGTKITVVELMSQLIPGCDPDLVRLLQRRIAGRYERILTGVAVEGVEAGSEGLSVRFSSGETEVFDRILVAVGRIPNGKQIEIAAAGVSVDERGFIPVDAQMRTNVPGIYAIGDIVGGPMLAHKATHEGKVAAEVIAGEAGAAFDPRGIPAVAYTDPEVAWVGLTETEAKASGIEYEKASFPWAASGRALSLAREEGVTKLLFEPGTRRLLGAGIVGVGAGELIAETVHALEMGSDAADIGLTIHPHPTLSETVGFAAELAEGTITDLLAPAKPAKATSGR